MEEKCSICFDETSHTLECKHFTCVKCLKRLIKKSNICPICRSTFNIEPYQYHPPKHTPNLNLTLKLKKKLNKFLGNRYLLNSKANYYKKHWANLMVAYHDYIYVDGEYINEASLQLLRKYDLLRLYIFFNTTKIYSRFTNYRFITAIELLICNPQAYELVGTLSFSSFP
jgi:hypothetical protein